MTQQLNNSNRRLNVSDGERLASLVGGGGLLLYATRRPSRRLLSAALGAGLLLRGLTGHSRLYTTMGVNTADTAPDGIRIEKTLTITRSPDEAYQFWRQLENLPRFMTHLESVQSLSGDRSYWTVKTPVGPPLTWEAQLTADRPGELIAWETLPKSAVQHKGRVRFTAAPAGRGTEVTVTLAYEPPGGAAGAAFAPLMNVVTAQHVKEEMRRFKAMIETGETPTVAGQPAGERPVFPLGVNVLGLT
jgi:uncharacterized membrane protein